MARRRTKPFRAAGEQSGPADAELDYWPILRQPDVVLAREIESGVHDTYLPQLQRMEKGHDARQLVIEACQSRLQAADEATDPGSDRPTPTKPAAAKKDSAGKGA